jgi:hypothetical protein
MLGLNTRKSLCFAAFFRILEISSKARTCTGDVMKALIAQACVSTLALVALSFLLEERKKKEQASRMQCLLRTATPQRKAIPTAICSE